MQQFIAYALVGSAMDEVVANPQLLKHAAADPNAELYGFLEKHAAEVRDEADCYCLAWLAGLHQKLAESGPEGAMLKQAWFGLEEKHPAANMALELAGYMTPGLGTGLLYRDALGNFKQMLAPGASWTSRLASGAGGLLNAGLGTLAMFPTLGILGLSTKAGKLSKLLGMFGKPGVAASQRWGNALLGSAGKPMQGILNAAQSGKGWLGKATRFVGFNPNYRAWFGGKNPYQYLKGVSQYMTGVQAAKTPAEAARFARRARLLGRLKSPQALERAKLLYPRYSALLGQPGVTSPLSVAATGFTRRTIPLQFGLGTLAGAPAAARAIPGGEPIPWNSSNPRYRQALLNAMA